MMKLLTLLFAFVLCSTISLAQVQNPQLKRHTDKLKVPGFNFPENNFRLKPLRPITYNQAEAKSKPAKPLPKERNVQLPAPMPVIKPRSNRNYSLLASSPDSSIHYQLKIKEVK